MRLQSLFSTLILTGLLFLPGFLMAGTTGKLSGKVFNAATKEPLIGASVFIVGTEKGAATDVDGEFFILNISPGLYTIRISSVGFTTKVVEKVRIQVDLTTKLDVELNEQDVELGYDIVITADRVVQKDLTSSERTFQSDLIADLPARDLSSMLSTQAGITRDSGGNLHIRGGRSTEISYMVDGVVVQNPLDRANAGISIDDQSIAELKAITGTFNAEYGQALSGVVNIVTKNGGDKFSLSGTAYLGDHVSFDNDLYRIMNNRDWAESIYWYTRFGGDMRYDFSKHGLSSPQAAREAAAAGNKPWMTYENYLNSYNPFQTWDLQLNSSGPLDFIHKNLSFFAAGRYQNRPGYEMGFRYFMPWGLVRPFRNADKKYDEPDGELVPLNWYKGWSTQTKLFWDSPVFDASYSLFYNSDHSYGGGSRFVPDGGRNYFTDRFTHIVSAQYVISTETFVDLKANYYSSNHKSYLYEDPMDYRYTPNDAGKWVSWLTGFGSSAVQYIDNDFQVHGNDLGRASTQSAYVGTRLDLTSQVDKYNMMKTGVSLTYHNKLNNYYYSVYFNDDQDIEELTESSPTMARYDANPIEVAAYIQDKIEYEELIINVGLRFDYFDSDGRVLSDPKDPQIYRPFLATNKYKNYDPNLPESGQTEYSVAEREKFWYKDADVKYQISPRLGISFPVTAEAVVHFSYGHFFQNPEFRYLYENPNFWISGSGTQNLVGNANLNPEKTIMYELGLKQRLFGSLDLAVTGFYRDISDWIGVGPAIDTYAAGVTYYKYENKDHASAKGITLAANQSIEDFYYSVDYTYQEAKGTSSDVTQAYYDQLSNRPKRLELITLNWDQTHSINTLASYTREGWTGTLIGKLASGFPYTPRIASNEEVGGGIQNIVENSERRPWTFNLDLRLSKSVKMNAWSMEYFIDVTNLLDTRNATAVYNDTGLPDETLDNFQKRTRLEELSTIRDNTATPGRYSAPRFVQIGIRFSLI
ncbi:MAG: carboxypeptidase-like regulatory domain-containing protein [Bacteroidetes bacterium]|nr:carboxypeptidase-like regulatory domain-containing protein [Bacteroidota bacterium]